MENWDKSLSMEELCFILFKHQTDHLKGVADFILREQESVFMQGCIFHNTHIAA